MRVSLRTTVLTALLLLLALSSRGQNPTGGERLQVLLSPDSGSKGLSLRPVFRWRGVPGALLYILQVAEDSSFAGAMAFEFILDDTALVPDRALANGTQYCWRVGAVDRDSVVTFGSHATFTTGLSPSSQPVRIPDSRKDEVTVACAVLYNHGVLPITIDSLSHHSRLFTGTLLPAVVAPGDSAVVQYNYHPRKFGVEVDTLTLYTDEGHCPVLLSAQCSPPVLHSMQSQVTLGPVALDDSAALSLVFVNGGRFNKLTVRKVWTRTQFFNASFLPLRVIEPGDTLRVPVHFHLRAFRPDAFGKYVDTCFVESDGGYGKVVLYGDSPSPQLWLEPQMLSFGDVAAHDTAFATLRLMNRSVNTARIDSVRNRNRNFRPMAGRMNVRAADTVSLTLRYTPTRFGTHVDTLVLFNNSWRGPVRVPVVGTAPFPVLETGVGQVDFEAVPRGDTVSVVLRLWNSSISTLRVESIRTKTRAFRLTRPSLPASVVKGDTVHVPLSFLPDSIRHFNDTLVIVSNAVGSPHQIPLRGDGVPPGVTAKRSGLPGAFELFQNFPNPFNASTTFRYALPEPCHVRLEIFTTLGQHVALLADGEQDAGFHNITWSTDVTSGIYYYRLTATPRGDPGRRYAGTRKMIVMR